MHELGITQSVVDTVLDAVAESRITRLRLEIGALSGVVPDAVRFCFDVVVTGTALEGAELDIVHSPGRGACRECGAEFELRDVIVLCDCGSADVAVLDGQQLRVTSVEVA